MIKSLDDLKKIRLLEKGKLNLMTIHLFSTIPIGGIKNKFPLSPDGYLYAIARMNAIKFLSRLKNEI